MYTNVIKETFRGCQTVSLSDEMFISRVISFTEEVTPKSMETLILQLLHLEQSSPGEKITLLINSPGGDVTSGLAAVDVMNSLTSPIRTVCTGISASMAVLLFLQGKERVALKHSTFMLHDPSFSGGDMAGVKPLNMQESLDRLFQIRKELAGIIAECTGNTLDAVYEKTKTDCYMNAQEALEFGIVNEIGKSVFGFDTNTNQKG